ncbi:hypothetical protein QBC35DRAFT_535695 [Podospora australis]|uniref:Uncharacterized protein n=1 Tax=Podospora australis TaxID=1536484 RepID=A0AAN6WKB1_9PEZI|nr:hypothetical protein QBC35DRAFT_535695 [Podospora australis]
MEPMGHDDAMEHIPLGDPPAQTQEDDETEVIGDAEFVENLTPSDKVLALCFEHAHICGKAAQTYGKVAIQKARQIATVVLADGPPIDDGWTIVDDADLPNYRTPEEILEAHRNRLRGQRKHSLITHTTPEMTEKPKVKSVRSSKTSTVTREIRDANDKSTVPKPTTINPASSSKAVDWNRVTSISGITEAHSLTPTSTPKKDATTTMTQNTYNTPRNTNASDPKTAPFKVVAPLTTDVVRPRDSHRRRNADIDSTATRCAVSQQHNTAAPVQHAAGAENIETPPARSTRPKPIPYTDENDHTNPMINTVKPETGYPVYPRGNPQLRNNQSFPRKDATEAVVTDAAAHKMARLAARNERRAKRQQQLDEKLAALDSTQPANQTTVTAPVVEAESVAPEMDTLNSVFTGMSLMDDDGY